MDAKPSPAGCDRSQTSRPKFLLVQEAAELLRIDSSTLYRHLRRNQFPGVKVGGRYLIPHAAVEQLADDALATGQCIVVEQWASQWREERAAVALARGVTKVSGSPVP